MDCPERQSWVYCRHCFFVASGAGGTNGRAVAVAHILATLVLPVNITFRIQYFFHWVLLLYTSGTVVKLVAPG